MGGRGGCQNIFGGGGGGGGKHYSFCESVFVALGIQNQCTYVVICDLPRSTIFFHIIS